MCIPPTLSIVYLPSSRELADMDEDEKVEGHVTDEVEDAICCDLECRASKGADSDFEDDDNEENGDDEENENDNHGDGGSGGDEDNEQNNNA
jgi:hypothetical protein